MESSTKKIITDLNRINWDIPKIKTPKLSIHSLHWFPGNFIYLLPSYLIKILSSEGALVLDPFCGSGTTGIEALLLNRRSIQSDNNSASITTTDAKIAVLSDPDITSKLSKFSTKLVWDSIVLQNYYSPETSFSNTNLKDWFHSYTFSELRSIWNLINCENDKNLKSVLRMIFSDLLFSCSSTSGSLTKTGNKRRHHWGWVADNVKPKEMISHNAIDLFKEKLFHAIDVSRRFKKHSFSDNLLMRQDARQLAIVDNSVDLVVTSPPYVGMIDYTLANRLHYLWMDWDIDKDKVNEIGARYRRNRKHAEEEYLSSINESAKEITRVIRPGGYCAIVIGSSTKYPFASEKVVKIFRQKMDLIWGPTNRTLTRRRVSGRKFNKTTEIICVLRKKIW